MSQALRKLTANASKCECTIIFLNQLRHKVGVVYGNPEVTSGGQALKFYASVRLEVRRKQTVEDSSGTGIGIKVKAKVCSMGLNATEGTCIMTAVGPVRPKGGVWGVVGGGLWEGVGGGGGGGGQWWQRAETHTI